MTARPQIMETARSWLGVPWRHQGRNRYGIDCAGLLCVVGWELGIPLVDKQGYQRVPDKTGFLDHLRSQLTRGSTTAIKEASVGVFRESRYPCHTGILSWQHGILYVLHATVARKKVVEEPIGDTGMALVSVLEFPGVEG